MNKLERTVHRALENYPAFKNSLRDIYQCLHFVKHQKNIVSGKLVVRPGFFYGFHTTCPWSADNSLLLTHKVRGNPLRLPHVGEIVEVGYFSGERYSEFHSLAETSAWNWQQGSMLQWVGGNENIIFNDCNTRKLCSRIMDVSGKLVSVLDYPIAAVSPDGKTAVSYSYTRLGVGMPGYGYSVDSATHAMAYAPDDDGLFIVDIDTGNAEMLFSLSEIVNKEPRAAFSVGYHVFSHCMFSPSGSRILFFHRWRLPGGAVKTRMISCDVDGKDVHIFSTGEMVSHICWQDESHILVYAERDTGEVGYYIFRDKSAEVFEVGKSYFRSDGHPQVALNKFRFVTDTYPDRNRMQRLFIYDLELDAGRELLRLRIPFKYRNKVRCDFHPRWDRSGRVISFDSAHTGVRSHCTLSAE